MGLQVLNTRQQLDQLCSNISSLLLQLILYIILTDPP